ncbi:hypothetical protein FC83_GL000967 [Agrilactobacillus composti DSM 18527 = JCM 14202]|uniref:Uncharacterized protein n=1 Tax=Agrilactobacillus composti DSM 18527 = JCM 14202 TaxID=1423734 RepID=X0PHX1_9LACO|nr:hypothetical protein [Agrilactobacillus composti]KRM35569.1 hypothetical protein FC83_GL000967 [Agrilactobacillus composti DSM 18527 = JCM 14202]GAF41628.1 hypothetical protein JCM14202_3583 [Agrilactobacillus composti DSM 18527 = JCM 14202]
MVLSEARKRANKRWDEKNRERKRYLNKRSTARCFIANHATDEDIETLQALINERKKSRLE